MNLMKILITNDFIFIILLYMIFIEKLLYFSMTIILIIAIIIRNNIDKTKKLK